MAVLAAPIKMLCFLSPQLVLIVSELDCPIQTSADTPHFPSISYAGPVHTPQAHDVTEPPAISSQLPEVS